MSMKKIINGKLYNTETANEVGSWSNGYYPNDFNYCAQTLYRKKTGEYFIYGEGGAMSRYASHSGNSSGYGESIEPLNFEQARKWAEKKLDADEYEAEFGTPEEDDSTVMMTLSIRSDIAETIRRIARENNIAIGELVTKLVQDYKPRKIETMLRQIGIDVETAKASGYLTTKTARNGREVDWYFNGNEKTEFAIYTDDGTQLSKEEIKKELA